jgi:AcrR family transcriptional regulator
LDVLRSVLNTFKNLLDGKRAWAHTVFEHVQNMATARSTPKAEETGLKILEAALELFREQGFDTATMRDIAQRAGVATGAAYYYYPSKDAIVTDFYRRASSEMQPKIEAALEGARGLEARMRALIEVKLAHFGPNRSVLRALLRSADPKHPLSPFGAETKEIRDIDMAWFRRILVHCGVRIASDLEPRLPGVLWFFQMGVIFFWVIDESPQQERTKQLLRLASKSITSLIRLSALPLMRPVRKAALDIVAVVTEG